MKMMVEHCFAGSPKEIEGIIYIIYIYIRLLLFFHFLFGHLKFLYENIPKPNCSRVC